MPLYAVRSNIKNMTPEAQHWESIQRDDAIKGNLLDSG